jgi:pseudouridine-5'-phosphate glycosidase
LNISGALITPFLLKRINEITGGESSKSNIALIKNNARVGGEIAVAIQKVQSKK